MEQALLLAQKAGNDGEIPVGAVIVKDGRIIASGRNRREHSKNALGHAELEAISAACTALDTWRLDGCELYVTLEPCPMCAGAIINSRISKVVFGAFDKKAGSASADSVIDLFSLPYNHRPQVWAGISEKECSKVLTDFFEDLRSDKGYAPLTSKPRYIREPTDLQCGQAVLAMLTDSSVEEIIKLCGTDRETDLRQMFKVLDSFGISYSKERIPVTDKSQLPDICILSLETPRCWHWSLYFKGTFYDPEHGVTDDFPESDRRYYWEISERS